jgi:hypothetical protein
MGSNSSKLGNRIMCPAVLAVVSVSSYPYNSAQCIGPVQSRHHHLMEMQTSSSHGNLTWCVLAFIYLEDCSLGVKHQSLTHKGTCQHMYDDIFVIYYVML